MRIDTTGVPVVDSPIGQEDADTRPRLQAKALAASAQLRRGAQVAEDKDKSQAEDLELSPDKAGDVKGGRLPTEPGSSARHLAGPTGKHAHGKKIPGPSGGMAHQ